MGRSGGNIGKGSRGGEGKGQTGRGPPPFMDPRYARGYNSGYFSISGRQHTLHYALDTRAGGRPDNRSEWRRHRGRPCRAWTQQIEDDIWLNAKDAWRIARDFKSGGRYDPRRRSSGPVSE